MGRVKGGEARMDGWMEVSASCWAAESSRLQIGANILTQQGKRNVGDGMAFTVDHW